MSQFDSEFLEEYRKLDDLIDENYKTYSGVSDYIKRMEANSFSGRRIIFDWDIMYKQLKYVSTLKEKIVNKQEADCTQDDIEFVMYFYDNVINGDDPLTEFDYLKQTMPTEKEEPFDDIFVEIPQKENKQSEPEKQPKPVKQKETKNCFKTKK